VANLRKMARVVGAPTSGAKNTLSTTVLAEVSKRLAASSHRDRETEWYRCCACGDGSSYKEWLESPRAQTMTWWKAPSDHLLKLQYPARLRNSSTGTRDENPAEDRPLNVNEYARLVCILTQQEDAKRALVDSQLDLTRSQLDLSERRADFWSLTIAPIFNSPDTAVSLHLPITLSGVCDEEAPLNLRSGSRLIQSWAGTRSLFTVIYADSYRGAQGPAHDSSLRRHLFMRTTTACGRTSTDP
jgi:hypothetical protein